MKLKTTQAFSMIELVVVVCLIGMVAVVVLPALAPPHAKCKAQRIQCVNNQKQIGTAYRIWAGDNNDRYPALVQSDATNAGWAQFTKMTNAGPYCWSNF